MSGLWGFTINRKYAIGFWRSFCFILAGARPLPRLPYDLTVDDPLNKVYYTTVQFFGTTIDVPRPAEDARAELRRYVALSPDQRAQTSGQQRSALQGDAEATLYRLLAEQD